MSTKPLIVAMAFVVLAIMAACTESTATPITIVETVVVTQPVEVEKKVEVVVTKEVEKLVTVEVEKQVVETVEVKKEVKVIETVEVTRVVTVQVLVTPTPTATPTVDQTNPKVYEVLHQITMVQHHHDPASGVDTFTCASRGKGLDGVEVDPAGPRFVGPNSKDFDLWGVVALFKINPDGSVELVPQQTGGKFIDPEGIEHKSFTLQEALSFFASGDAIWIGAHGEPGHIGECDPQYKTPTPVPND